MQVAEILREKGNRVIAVDPDKKIVDVAQVLRQENIGAALVRANGGEILGIISERDIVHTIAENGPVGLEMPAADVMTRSIVTCAPDTDTETLMQDMLSAQIRHIPVIKDGVPIGIVSVRDVVNSVVTGLKRVRDAFRIQPIVPARRSTDEE